MTTPAMKRFDKTYLPIANAVSATDIGQVNREKVAAALTEALTGRPDFDPKLFQLLASDPMVPYAGYGDEPCPDGIVIRVSMHFHGAPDGRNIMWHEEMPHGCRCMRCGSAQYLGIPR